MSTITKVYLTLIGIFAGAAAINAIPMHVNDQLPIDHGTESIVVQDVVQDDPLNMAESNDRMRAILDQRIHNQMSALLSKRAQH